MKNIMICNLLAATDLDSGVVELPSEKSQEKEEVTTKDVPDVVISNVAKKTATENEEETSQVEVKKESTTGRWTQTLLNFSCIDISVIKDKAVKIYPTAFKGSVGSGWSDGPVEGKILFRFFLRNCKV